MEYEIVTLREKIAVGVSARTNNTAPDMGEVIGGLWKRLYGQGVYESIPFKADKKALGIYTEYAENEKADYTAMAACETTKEPANGDYAVCRIPAGRYAKFVVHGDMVQTVAAAWQEIWQMDLPRSFQCDFEEYQDDSVDNAEIHIYVGLKEETKMKLEGFGILVKDMAVMIRFYRDVLGFEIKESEDAKNVYLEKDGTLFLLYGRKDFEDMTGRRFGYVSGDSGHFEIALGVEDYAAVDRAYEEIVAKGGKAIMEPTTEPWGQRTCYIADPEGNMVEIGSFNPGKGE